MATVLLKSKTLTSSIKDFEGETACVSTSKFLKIVSWAEMNVWADLFPRERW